MTVHLNFEKPEYRVVCSCGATTRLKFDHAMQAYRAEDAGWSQSTTGRIEWRCSPGHTEKSCREVEKGGRR